MINSIDSQYSYYQGNPYSSSAYMPYTTDYTASLSGGMDLSNPGFLAQDISNGYNPFGSLTVDSTLGNNFTQNGPNPNWIDFSIQVPDWLVNEASRRDYQRLGIQPKSKTTSAQNSTDTKESKTTENETKTTQKTTAEATESKEKTTQTKKNPHSVEAILLQMAKADEDQDGKVRKSELNALISQYEKLLDDEGLAPDLRATIESALLTLNYLAPTDRVFQVIGDGGDFITADVVQKATKGDTTLTQAHLDAFVIKTDQHLDSVLQQMDDVYQVMFPGQSIGSQGFTKEKMVKLESALTGYFAKSSTNITDIHYFDYKKVLMAARFILSNDYFYRLSQGEYLTEAELLSASDKSGSMNTLEVADLALLTIPRPTTSPSNPSNNSGRDTYNGPRLGGGRTGP